MTAVGKHFRSMTWPRALWARKDGDIQQLCQDTDSIPEVAEDKDNKNKASS